MGLNLTCVEMTIPAYCIRYFHVCQMTVHVCCVMFSCTLYFCSKSNGSYHHMYDAFMKLDLTAISISFFAIMGKIDSVDEQCRDDEFLFLV